MGGFPAVPAAAMAEPAGLAPAKAVAPPLLTLAPAAAAPPLEDIEGAFESLPQDAAIAEQSNAPIQTDREGPVLLMPNARLAVWGGNI